MMKRLIVCFVAVMTMLWSCTSKREKMEKLLKKADDAAAASRYSEAQTWLKQARLLATADKQKEIDDRVTLFETIFK